MCFKKGCSFFPMSEPDKMQAAERNLLNPRFEVRPDLYTPQMHITDTTTGRSTLVPMSGYGTVRQVLFDLFQE